MSYFRSQHLVVALLFGFLSAPLFAQSIDKLITPALWRSDLNVIDNTGLEFRGGLDYSLRQTSQKSLAAPLHVDNLGGFSTIEFFHNPGETPRFIAFSDNNGLWIEMSLQIVNGTLSGVDLLRMGTLIDPETQKPLQDIESQARAEKGFYLAFEGSGKLWELDKLDGTPRISAPLKGVKGFHQNGIESLTLLKDKRLLAIAELQVASEDVISTESLGIVPRDQTRMGWMQSSEGSANFETLAFYRRGRLDPGGSTTLANGEVLILYKHYDHISGKNHIAVERVKSSQLKAGSLVGGEVLLEVRSKRRKQQVLDNMEGISSFQLGGETFILLASDDNLHWKNQKNRLLLFRLK